MIAGMIGHSVLLECRLAHLEPCSVVAFLAFFLGHMVASKLKIDGEC